MGTRVRTRWDMLQDGFATAGISVDICRRGRDGAEFINIADGEKAWITIHDRYYRGHWAGWTIDREDREGFGKVIKPQVKTVDEAVQIVMAELAKA